MSDGPSLATLRGRIESLAVRGGDYYVACARTGARPVPVDGMRFADREDAAAGARLAARYRARLRGYDPRVAYHDLVVRQDVAVPTEPRPRGSEALTSFAHDVAGALLETLREAGHEGVERVVSDTYVELAWQVPDPDELCLRLLERLSAALAEQLSPEEQATVLAAAAGRLDAVPAADPLTAALASLRRLGLVGGFERSPWSVDLDDGRPTVEVTLSRYALSPSEGRLPTLPLLVALHRRRGDDPVGPRRAIETADGWRVTLAADADGGASVPIRSEE